MATQVHGRIIPLLPDTKFGGKVLSKKGRANVQPIKEVFEQVVAHDVGPHCFMPLLAKGLRV